jgi:dGTP triphosphohydrolase
VANKKPHTITQYIRYFVDDSAALLRPFIAQGKFNNEFIQGRQNKKINIKTLSIEDKMTDPNLYVEKKVFNKILPIYLTRYGILTQNMPIPGIKPIKNTAEEVENARKVNDFISSYISSCY